MIALCGRIASRLTRNTARSWWVPVAVVSALIGFTFTAAVVVDVPDSVHLERNLSGFEVVAFNVAVVQDPGVLDPDLKLRELIDHGATEAAWSIEAILADPERPNNTVLYRELSSTADLHRRGYDVTSGDLPIVPGEVLVSDVVGDPSRLYLPDRLTVVGGVTDRNSPSAGIVVAAPGTWESFGWPETEATHPRLSANLSMYTSGVDVSVVENVLRSSASDIVVLDAVRLLSDDHQSSSTLARFPWLYTYPSMVLPITAVVLVGWFRRDSLRELIRNLHSQGAPRILSGAAVASAITIVGILAGILGVATGWLLAALALPGIESLIGHPLSDLPPPFDPILRTSGALCLAALFVGIATSGSMREPNRALTRAKHATRHVIDIVAIVLAAISLVAVVTVNDSLGALAVLSLLLALIALVSPRLVRAIGLRIQPTSPTRRLLHRRIAAEPRTVAAYLTMTALVFGPMVGVLVLTSSSIAQDNARELFPPAEGQVVVHPSGSPSADNAAESAIQSASASPRVQVGQAITNDGSPVVATPDGLGVVAIMESSSEIAAAFQTTLTHEAIVALEQGGVLFTENSTTDPSAVWSLDYENGGVVRIDVPTSALLSDGDPRWRNEAPAIMLRETAEALGFSVDHYLDAYTHVTEPQAQAAQEELSNNGYDASIIRTFRPGQPFELEGFALVIVGLMVMSTALVLALITRTSVTAMAELTAAMQAIGAPRRWVQRVFLLEAAIGATAGSVLGGAGGLLVMTVAHLRWDLPVVIPWLMLVTTVVASFRLGAVTAVAQSTRLVPTRTG